MRLNFLLFCFFLPCWLAAQSLASDQTVVFTAQKFTLHCTPADSALSADLTPICTRSIDSIERFFGHPFPRKFEVFIFPNRAALDRQWQQDWGDTTFYSACWMVASGVAHRLDVLSPDVWDKEACEHKADDASALSRLFCHELTHVYHGQHNPKPDFTGMDDMAWWVEGIAVYASGQLDEARIQGVQVLLESGKAPVSLQLFWSGKYKYGLAGSLAKWVDVKYGRSVLFKLLTLTETNQALKLLDISEQTLLNDWRYFWQKKQ